MSFSLPPPHPHHPLGQAPAPGEAPGQAGLREPSQQGGGIAGHSQRPRALVCCLERDSSRDAVSFSLPQGHSIPEAYERMECSRDSKGMESHSKSTEMVGRQKRKKELGTYMKLNVGPAELQTKMGGAL